MSDPLPTLVGVLLVGGESRRFGGPKQLAPLAGEPLALRVYRTLAPLVERVVVVGGGALPSELESLERIDDAPGVRGPIAGLLGALRALPDSALLAVACDQPLVSAEALVALVAARRAGAPAVVARLGRSGIEPLPAIYEPACLELLERSAAERGSLQPVGDDPATVVIEPGAVLRSAWTSVDTPERLREIESLLRGEVPLPDARFDVRAANAVAGTASSTIDPPPDGRESVTGDPRAAGGEPELDWAELGHVFRAQEIAARRYRIERLIGRGAMGEVYAALDLELASEVALKVLHLGPRADREAIGRFKREILLARRVSHPNVCRIFDLGVHWLGNSTGKDAKPILFLTMELLAGETLVERLERTGPLEEAEALSILRQLAEALRAAHAAGVIHRDLKSSNVVLVPDGEGVRAVVTDFGLAREQRSDPHGETWTETGGVLGTPAYMAPEQVEGKPADARSDLYSLGIVLYELASGRLPFEGESPLSIAMKRLKQDPTPIERHRATLTPRFRRIVERLLARDPRERFLDAAQLLAALDGDEVPLARRARWPLVVGVAAALVAVAAGVGYVLVHRSTAAAEAAAQRPSRRAFAVLPLRNASGAPESAWLSTALAEMLTTELAAGDRLRAIPGESVARALRDLELSEQAAFDDEALPRLRRALGAELAIGGAFALSGAPEARRIRLDLRIQPLDGGALQTRAVEGAVDDLFAVAGTAGAQLRSALGVGARPAAADVSSRAGLPRSEAAIRLYSLGLESLRRAEPQEARVSFEAALADDPESPLVWAALSESWKELGYLEKARETAAAAHSRAHDLPRVEALRIEGQLRRAESSWEAAVEIQGALWRLFGDDPEYGLELADTLIDAGRAQEAQAVVAALARLPAPASDDARIDLAAARVAESLSDLEGHLAAARRAGAKAESAGAKTLIGLALMNEGVALRRLGRPDESRTALDRARALAFELGDRHAAARALLSIANLERAAERVDEATVLYAEARSIFEAIGNRQLAARAELLQGLVESQRGEIDAALALYESALAKLIEVGDRRGAAAALSNIGTMLYERGDLAGALARHERAIVELRALGDETKVVVSLANLAQIRLDRGELAAARRDLDEELSIAGRVGDLAGEGHALLALGELAALVGSFDEADDRFRAAEERFERVGQGSWRLEARRSRAVMTRERGRAAESLAELDRLIAESEASESPNREDLDLLRLERIRSLIAAGRGAEVDSATGELLARAGASATARSRRAALWVRAEWALVRGARDEARRAYDELEAQAAAGGLAIVALEARAARSLAFDDDASKAVRAGLLAEAERLGAGRIAARLRSGARLP